MSYYTKVLDNCVVLQISSGTGYAAVPDVQSAFNQARTAALPLFIRPGTYTSTEILVNSSTGSGNPLTVSAQYATVTIQLVSGNNLLNINGIFGCQISNIFFDANNINFSNLSNYSSVLSITNSSNTTIQNCNFANSVACGIYVTSGSGRFTNNNISNCSFGLFCIDCQCVVDGNTVSNSSNNGIQVWTSTVVGNNSFITNNKIFNVGSGSGTGQNGNGIIVYRAIGVNIIGNQIVSCQYSGIRCNAGGDAIIVGNNLYGLREFGIFIEAPASNANFTGGIVSGNSIDTAGGGISVANTGSGGQGTARSVTITGNRISSITKNTINDPGYLPTVGQGFGISIELACIVSGNIIDGAAGAGILAGHNGVSDVNVGSNLILNSPIGVGYSISSAGQLVVSGNQISGAGSDAIIAVQYNDTTDTFSVVSGATNYGNQYDAQEGNVFVGNNRSY